MFDSQSRLQEQKVTEQHSLVIRPAEPADQFNTRAVQWSVGWKEAPEHHRHWPAPDGDWIARHYFREFVAEIDGVVAGRIGLEAYCPPFAELVNLCVRPDFRRHGIGELLTRAGQRAAAQMGFPFLFLQTEMDNTGAHRLYTSQDWVPTAYGKMLRMVKLVDYPLLSSFKRTHALCQYSCTPEPGVERIWNMEWHAYVTEDYLRLRLESGASQSDSGGLAPAISGCEWSVGEGARSLSIQLEHEHIFDIEPGHHVGIDIHIRNQGKRVEEGACQLVLPPNIFAGGSLSGSISVSEMRTLHWRLNPGESICLPVVIQIEPHFDAAVLWHLNYASVPVSVETFWEGHRALLSTCLPMAVPPPT